MRRAGKIDSNQNGIVKSLRGLPGVSVSITSQLGNGFVDIIVGYKGVNYLFEIKDGNKPPSQQKLTPDEVEWHSKWKGQKAVVTTFDEIFKIIHGKKD